MGFVTDHPVAVAVALIVLTDASYAIFDLAVAPGADFDPVMR